MASFLISPVSRPVLVLYIIKSDGRNIHPPRKIPWKLQLIISRANKFSPYISTILLLLSLSTVSRSISILWIRQSGRVFFFADQRYFLDRRVKQRLLSFLLSFSFSFPSLVVSFRLWWNGVVLLHVTEPREMEVGPGWKPCMVVAWLLTSCAADPSFPSFQRNSQVFFA